MLNVLIRQRAGSLALKPRVHFLSQPGSQPRCMVATLLNIFSQFSTTMAAQQERTFIMVKPDGVHRGLIGDIVKRFEQKGFKLVAMKLMHAGKELLQKHYAELSEKGFFKDLIEYMSSGPLVPMASEDHLKKHYSELATKPFFPKLVKYMSSGPVVPMVWEGKNVVKTGRIMLGETNPFDSKPGTIRGDFCIEIGRNICHGSDGVESAQKEIDLWFSKDEQVQWTPVAQNWVYE